MESALFKIGKETTPLFPELFGIALDEANRAIDGGLNANMVRNHSFDEVHLSQETKVFSDVLAQKRLAFWDCSGLTLRSILEDGVSPNSYYARICVEKYGILFNEGYNASSKNNHKLGYFCRLEENYVFSAYLRNIDFKGSVTVCICNASGEPLTNVGVLEVPYEWTKITLPITCLKEGFGKLEFIIEGAGRFDMDCVVFRPEIVWGQGDPKYKEAFFRKDLVEMMKAQKPSFIRFPGITMKKLGRANEFPWRNSVGPLVDRIGVPNFWASLSEHQSSYQSLQLGVYEYLCLCEDLHAEPVPVISISDLVNDQVMAFLQFAMGTFGEEAKLRASMGHEKPFAIHYLVINGNNLTFHQRGLLRNLENRINEKYENLSLVFKGEKPKRALFSFREYGNDKHVLNKKNSFVRALREVELMINHQNENNGSLMLCYCPFFSMVGCNFFSNTSVLFSPAYAVKTTSYQVAELFCASKGSQKPVVEGKGAKKLKVAVSEDEKGLYIQLLNLGFTEQGAEFELPFKRGSATVSLFENTALVGDNTLSFHGRPQYIYNVRKVQNEIFDGFVGVPVPPRTYISLEIRKTENS